MNYLDFSNLKSANDLEEYFGDRCFKHKEFCHYTSVDVLDSILEKKELWISNVNGFNDDIDKMQFKNLKKYYSICFSSGINENLPLWYMYAGLGGKGVRLEWTPTYLKQMVNEGSFYLCEKLTDYKLNGNKLKEITHLEKDKTIKIEFRDVLYQKKDKKYCQLKYNNLTNYIILKDELDKYAINHIGFLKGIPWYYEKETRLLVTLKEEIEMKLDQNKEYVVVLKLKDKWIDHLKIRFAPNVSKDDMHRILEKNGAIRDYVFMTSNINLSDYEGTVQFDFCKNCSNNRKS